MSRGVAAGGLYCFKHRRQGRFCQVILQGGFGGGEHLVERSANAISDRASGIGLGRGGSKGFGILNCAVNLRQVDAGRRSAEARTRASSFARFDQFCPFEREKQPPDNDRVRVHTQGDQFRGDTVALFKAEDCQDVYRHAKSATRSHVRYVISIVTTVKEGESE